MGIFVLEFIYSETAILLSHHFNVHGALYFCIHFLDLALMISILLQFLPKFNYAWCLALIAVYWSRWLLGFIFHVSAFFYHIGMTDSNSFGSSSSFHVHWRRKLSLRQISLHLRVSIPVDGAIGVLNWRGLKTVMWHVFILLIIIFIWKQIKYIYIKLNLFYLTSSFGSKSWLSIDLLHYSFWQLFFGIYL